MHSHANGWKKIKGQRARTRGAGELNNFKVGLSHRGWEMVGRRKCFRLSGEAQLAALAARDVAGRHN